MDEPKTVADFLSLPAGESTRKAIWTKDDTVLQAVDTNGDWWKLDRNGNDIFRIRV